jgi:integrase/recombinase XerD
MKLSRAIRRYVEWKRFCGRSFVTGEQVLLGLRRFAGDVELSEITRKQVFLYLRGHRIRVATWEGKYGVLALFFRHWAQRGELRVLPLPPHRRVPQTLFVPHVYSRTQIQKLLATIPSNQRSLNCMIDARTLRAFLMFLYGTGAYVGEALHLKTTDVDFERGLIKVRRVAGTRERTLPITGKVHRVLQEYRHAVPESYRASQAFFVDKLGRPLNPTTVSKMFQKLRRRAGIYRTDGLRTRPRLHDFRHTFAVHCLTKWLNQGNDLRRMLPALSAYLGLTKLASAERYLRMVPDRFRPHLIALVGK